MVSYMYVDRLACPVGGVENYTESDQRGRHRVLFIERLVIDVSTDDSSTYESEEIFSVYPEEVRCH